ncbi:MAG: DMT family transporter [Parahaliea sp.]
MSDLHPGTPVNIVVTNSKVATGRQRKALASLIGAGFLLALSTSLAKQAATMGLAPLPFLVWSLAGATLVLYLYTRAQKSLAPINRQNLTYFLVSGLLSVAGSNLIFFSAIPHIGAGFVALVISLPPILTYIAALAFGMEQFDRGRCLGVMAAMTGAAWLAFRKVDTEDVAIAWLALTALGPALLAAGNIYRSARWPAGLSAQALAPGMVAAATAMLGVAALAWGLPLNLLSFSREALILTGVQSMVFAGQFLLLFILQNNGGPVFLSLLGAIGATFGIPIAVYLLGEELPHGLAVGGLLIGLGVFLLAKFSNKEAGAEK